MVATIYTRLSFNKPGQTSTGRQEEFARAWVADQGGKTLDVFIDKGKSAYNTNVVRPAYQALLDAVRAERVGTIVVWRWDRLARTSGEFEELVALCRAKGVAIRSTTEPGGMEDPFSRVTARWFVMSAGLEMDIKSARSKHRNLEKALAAFRSRRPPTGGPMTAPRSSNQKRSCSARQSTASWQREGITAIVRDWEARGVLYRNGRPFTIGNLRGLLIRRGIAGDRDLGEVVVEGCWEPIVDPLKAAQARLILCGQYARRLKDDRCLLAGKVSCWRCGGAMSPGKNQPNPSYGCNKAACKGANVRTSVLDAWVADQVACRLALREHGGRKTLEPGERRRGHRDARWLADVLRAVNRAYFVDAAMSRPEWVRLRDSMVLTAAQQAARRGMTRPEGLPRSVEPLGRVGEHWDKLNQVTRRQVVDLELGRVVVHPAIGTMWNPERLEVAWLCQTPRDGL